MSERINWSDVLFTSWRDVSLPPSEFPREGRDAVCSFLASLNLAPPPYYSFPWDLVITAGVYRGRLHKRLANFYGDPLRKNPEALTTLSNLIAQYTPPPFEYSVRFTRKLEWRDGDYGDSGSCFFSPTGCNRHHPAAIQDAGGMAFLIRSVGRGFGRALILPPSCHGEGEYLYAFNCYFAHGRGGAEENVLPLLKIALGGWGMERVDFYSDAYINDSDAYLFAPATLPNINALRLDFNVDDFEHLRGVPCSQCGDNCDPEDSPVDPDGNTICAGCYHDHCADCAECDETVWTDGCEFTHDDEYFCCERHISRHHTQCADCEAWADDDSLETVERDDNEKEVCESCAEDYYPCDGCESRIYADDLRRGVDSEMLCSDCWDEAGLQDCACGNVHSGHNATCADCAVDSLGVGCL